MFVVRGVGRRIAPEHDRLEPVLILDTRQIHIPLFSSFVGGDDSGEVGVVAFVGTRPRNMAASYNSIISSKANPELVE
jgi:hypothetical protein